MTPKEIRLKINELWSSHLHGSARIIHALAQTLSDRDLLELVEDVYFGKEMNIVIGWTSDGSPRFSMLIGLVERRGLKQRLAQRQKKAILTALSELSKGECNNKTFLLNELKSRYHIASEADKRRIVLFMLQQPTKKERQWVYSRIKSQWDDSYREAVIHAFEVQKDNAAYPVIMKHFPTEYIYQHKERLAAIKGYLGLYRTIGREHPEEVNLEKLTPTEQVNVIRTLKMTEHADIVEKLLYRSIASEVMYILSWGEVDAQSIRFDYNNERPHGIDDFHRYFYLFSGGDDLSIEGFYLPRYFGIREDKISAAYHTLSLFSFNGVGKALNAMGVLGMTDAIVRFEGLCRDLQFEFVTYPDEDKRRIPSAILCWLQKIYDKINKGMMGYGPLPQRYNTLLSLSQLKDIEDALVSEEEKASKNDGEDFFFNSHEDEVPF